MKIQDLAAIVGGFMKIVLLFGEIISRVFNIFTRNEALHYELFEYNVNIQKENK